MSYEKIKVNTGAAQSLQAEFLLWQRDSVLPRVTGLEALLVSQETPLVNQPFILLKVPAAAVKTVQTEDRTT